MKIIDLLNKIANGEEVPKKIYYNCVPLHWCEPCKIYETMTDGELCGKDLYTLLDNLNDEVEIIEEIPKISKLYINNKLQYNLEEKKIPEKIEKYEDEEGIYFINNHCKKIYITSDEVDFMVEEFNQLIDYLKSKGE